MINEVDADVWVDWKESVEALHRLEEFNNHWQSANKKTEDVWTSFRLLPLHPAYLIASHHYYDQPGWSLRTKWSLYVQFDEALHSGKDLEKISSSISSALNTQRKIVALKKIFATQKDRTKTLQDKARVYKEDPKLYQDIAHNIWIAKGKPSNKNEAEGEISQRPDGHCSKNVIDKMRLVYEEGYPELGDHFFTVRPNPAN